MYYAELLRAILINVGHVYIVLSCIIGTYAIITNGIIIKNVGLKVWLKMMKASVDEGSDVYDTELEKQKSENQNQ